MTPELVAFEDLSEFGEETTDELEALAQDLYHRLIEPPGSNLDDADRGLGLEDALSGPIDPALRQRIEDEVRKDERVTNAKCDLTEIASGSYRIVITVEVDESEIDLTLETDADGFIRRV